MDMNQKTREHETHHSHDTITVQHCFHEHDQKMNMFMDIITIMVSYRLFYI